LNSEMAGLGLDNRLHLKNRLEFSRSRETSAAQVNKQKNHYSLQYTVSGPGSRTIQSPPSCRSWTRNRRFPCGIFGFHGRCARIGILEDKKPVNATEEYLKLSAQRQLVEMDGRSPAQIVWFALFRCDSNARL
jgi:hypothetical protein